MPVTLLALSDIHNQKITLDNIINKVKELDDSINACVIAGDITNFGSYEDLDIILDTVYNFCNNTFYVLGNCDPYFNSDEIMTKAKYIESNLIRLDFFSIIGFGFHKPRLDHKLLKKINKTGEKLCLLTHAPPYGTKADMVSLDRHAGSKEIKFAIKRYQNIFLSVSGHIHESPSISSVFNCIIINPGPVTRGNFALIKINEEFNVNVKIYNIHEMKS
jgi:Icc-related predicted phosphoesterase